MKNELIECTQVGADCIPNEPENIVNGEPEFFGFDFYVPVEQTKEMEEFIAAALIEFEIPLINVYSSGRYLLEKKDVWSKEEIIMAIKRQEAALKQEAKKNSR